MSGRDHLSSKAFKLRELPRAAVPLLPLHHPIDDQLPHLVRGPQHRQSTILEDRIAIQQREIKTLLLDNQRLAATHLVLKQDLALARQDLRHLSATAADVKAERDDRVREIYERSLKLDAEVLSIDSMSAELAHVRADIQKLTAHRQELNAELNEINDDLAKARTEAQQVPVIKAEIETVQKEIQRGRAAVECERKNRSINFQHSQVMERNMVAMAREIKKLHVELQNLQKRAWAAVPAAAATNPSPGYAGNYVNSEIGNEGSPYADASGIQQQSHTDS